MKMVGLFQDEFYHDGRGPELLRAVWVRNGTVLKGFEYFNPDDDYTEKDVKHLILEQVEAVSLAGEEVHGEILATANSKLAIFKVIDSNWMQNFNLRHLGECSHYQIIFYDEIYDVICKDIKVGRGRIADEKI